VVNPRRAEKVLVVARRQGIEEAEFERVTLRLLRVWLLLP
jgi:hypothetical protein